MKRFITFCLFLPFGFLQAQFFPGMYVNVKGEQNYEFTLLKEEPFGMQITMDYILAYNGTLHTISLLVNGELVHTINTSHLDPNGTKNLAGSTLGPYLASLIFTALRFLGALGITIVEYFQQYAIGCLTALSPLMIGLLAISYTQNIGIKFLLTSLNVMMWSLGFILVDLFLAYLGSGVMAGMLSSGIGARFAVLEIISWPAAVGAMLITALVPTFLYLATPMAVASLMAGANAGAAAAWGGLSNMSQTAQQVTRGGAVLQQMKGNLNAASGTQNTASTGGTIPRPPNPIV